MSFSYSICSRETKKGTVYDARFRVVDGRGIERQKRLCGFKTKGEAKKAAVKFLSTYIPEAPPAPTLDPADKMPFEKALAAYLAFDRLQTKDVTVYEKTKLFKLHITPYFEGKDIRSITKKDIAEWQDILWAKTSHTRNDKLLSARYLDRIRSTLHCFFRWCAERYDTPSPMLNLSAPKRREAKQPLEFYELEEFNRLLSVIDSQEWRTLIMFLFYVGCRVGELQALSEADIAPDGVHIYKTYTKKTTDGSPYKITDTKNYKVRTVPLPEILKTELDKYIAIKRENGIADTFLFGGDRPVALQSIRNRLDHYIELSGVKRIRIHGFRHSYVSMCAHLGATPVVIAHLIGDTIETVMQVYTHIWAGDGSEIVMRINRLASETMAQNVAQTPSKQAKMTQNSTKTNTREQQKSY